MTIFYNHHATTIVMLAISLHLLELEYALLLTKYIDMLTMFSIISSNNGMRFANHN